VEVPLSADVEPWIRVQDLAVQHNVCHETIRRWCKRHGLPHRVVAGRLVFRQSEVEAWMESRRRVAA
jgi:excisionase family DNA binding protein